ncbi:hypothetical protein GCM10022233_26020 [Streptomyces shaanxiensis]|uniref:Uncharacterized protein n=1 Tax=Streptomyces shaanxiensis TaxID=653357 RepID=A0ABP7UUT1_9ACTN
MPDPAPTADDITRALTEVDQKGRATMASDARARLSSAIRMLGHDGQLLVFKDPDDALGTTADGADPAPHSGIERPALRERVARANARSRGEIL